MPGDDRPRSGVAWCSHPPFTLAFPLAAVVQIHRALPPTATETGGWWTNAAPVADARYLQLRADGRQAWVEAGSGLEMVPDDRLERIEVPSLVAEHLETLGVVGILRRGEDIAYLLSPSRLVGGGA